MAGRRQSGRYSLQFVEHIVNNTAIMWMVLESMNQNVNIRLGNQLDNVPLPNNFIVTNYDEKEK